MKTIATFYIILYLIIFLTTPFFFGDEKRYKEFNATEWLTEIIITVPLIYLLFRIIIE